MGCRIISLADYRQVHLKKGREILKGARSKKISRAAAIETWERLVGPHGDSAERAVSDAIFSQTNVSPGRWDHRIILTAIFFLGCLVMVGLGL